MQRGESAGLASLFDGLLSVDAVKVYKPDPRVYQLAVQRLGVKPHEISFQSANGWDAAGAAKAGLLAIWINRSGQPVERLPVPPPIEIGSMSELPAVLGHG